MNGPKRKSVIARSLIALTTIVFVGCADKDHYALPDYAKLAKEYYQEDAQWYLDNIPFFECSDKQIRAGILLPVETLQSTYPQCW